MDNPNLPSKQNERTERKFAEPAEHTPGPWHVSRGELSGHIEIGVDDARDNFICTMHRVPPADNEPNARLIAAAPDMLAALIGAEYAMAHHNKHRKHQSYQCDYDFAEGFGGTLDNVRAAIAKATGAA